MISNNAFDGVTAGGTTAHGPTADGRTGDGPVVVGFDGSPSAWQALRWAADDAGGRRAELEVVCCVDDSSPAAAITAPVGADPISTRQQLDEAARVAGLRGAQIRVHASLAEGRPGDVLVDRSQRAVELVLGHHDPGSAPAPDEESLSAYCRTNAVCPVTVVDSTSQPDHQSAYEPATASAGQGDERT
ncbi:MAG: hypothetical protein QOF30_2424 [Acidimicrobiaceae bacterium]|jgi:nucleotide-binding universal stress UspA family protein|nr:hypothetical protein [Acidimicrobiaceae bacterium]